jgi:hypothetical protein
MVKGTVGGGHDEKKMYWTTTWAGRKFALMRKDGPQNLMPGKI